MTEKEEPNKLNPNDPAISMIRHKIAMLHSKEPNATDEMDVAKDHSTRSSHQQFMYDLSTSGKSLAEIQTAWHNYYIGLPDDQKHKVWQEFYEANDHNKNKHASPKVHISKDHAVVLGTDNRHISSNPKTITQLKQDTLKLVSKKRRPTAKQHFKSLLFGLSAGMITVFILLFGFFNDRFIAPFISPSRNVSSTPILIDANSTLAVGPEPKLIIPKINIELPVKFKETSTNEKAVQAALKTGVVHYPTTSYPGQIGNGAIFGHSSGNILNSGQFKFAFSLLRKLEIGDTFMIQKDSKPYFYKIYKKHVVPPTDVSVLDTQDKPATFTLITCDPPGLSSSRLIIVGEQVSPNPIKNTESTAAKSTLKPDILPSNSESLWQRLWSWISG